MWGRMHQQGEQPNSGLYPYNTIASCSLVISKQIFNNLGGYNEDLIFQGEDIDLSNRINNLSIPIYAVFDVLLFHNHQDRLTIKSLLKREYSGYASEMHASKTGIISTHNTNEYAGVKRIAFEFLRHTENAWIFILNILPRVTPFSFLNNRIIGALSSLQRYKQWRKIILEEAILNK
jgi:GT2 family glycosyltransferase